MGVRTCNELETLSNYAVRVYRPPDEYQDVSDDLEKIYENEETSSFHERGNFRKSAFTWVRWSVRASDGGQSEFGHKRGRVVGVT